MFSINHSNVYSLISSCDLLLDDSYSVLKAGQKWSDFPLFHFFSLRLISSYYWNHIPKNHSRICTLLFRSWFCLWTFSSKRTLDEAFILHIQLEMGIFGFRTPWAWISLDAEVPLEGSLLFGEPSIAAVAASSSTVPRKEAEAVLLLLLMVYCFFWLPDSICFPVKNKEKKKSIAWEHYYFQPSVPHHFYFQQNGFQTYILKVVTDTNIAVTATQLYCNRTLLIEIIRRYFIKLSCYSKQYIFTLMESVEGVKAFLIQTYDTWLSPASYSLDRKMLAQLYLVKTGYSCGCEESTGSRVLRPP